MKNICGSWQEVKILTCIGIWKKLISTLMDDFKVFNTSAAEIISDVVGKARELELEVKPKDVTELLQSHD